MSARTWPRCGAGTGCPPSAARRPRSMFVHSPTTHSRCVLPRCTRVICRMAAAECNKARSAKELVSAKTVAAVERLARSDRRLAATTDQWDADLWLLNTPKGAVDLRAGSIRPPRAEDYFIHLTPVAPR